MEEFKAFFPKISEAQWAQLYHYQELLLEWNAKINLISRKDSNIVFERHILPILPAITLPYFQSAHRIIDVGTGGGIPGVPLAILYPQIQFQLVDSIHKKIKALQNMIDTLHLTNVQTICNRIEQLKLTADIYVGRGVKAFHEFVSFIAHCSSSKQYSILYWTGGDVKFPYQSSVQVFALDTFFEYRYCPLKKILFFQKVKRTFKETFCKRLP